MNYKEYKLRDGYIIDLVKEIIELDNLNADRRSHDIAHKRYYLMHYLRQNTSISLEEVGRMLNKHHATVLNGLKRHKDFMQFRDEVYLENIKNMKEYLEGALVQ